MCFSFGGTVQYMEESNIYLCFVVYRLTRGIGYLTEAANHKKTH